MDIERMLLYIMAGCTIITTYIAVKKEYGISFIKAFSFLDSKQYEKFHKILGRIQQVSIMLVIMLTWLINFDAKPQLFIPYIITAIVFGMIMYRSFTAGYATIPQSKYHPAVRTVKYIIIGK